MKRNTHLGQALVPVLFVMVAMTSIAAITTLAARQEAENASRSLDEDRAWFIEQGAVTYIANELEDNTQGGTLPADLPVDSNADGNGWTPMGIGWYKATVIDTASRIDINTAAQNVLGQLSVFQEQPDLLEALLDWRGTMPNDSLENYYQSLNPPYDSKRAFIDTPEELLLIQGFTPDILYSVQSSTAANNAPNPFSQMGMPQGGQATVSNNTLPLIEMITPYSGELNVDSNGNQRVNITTAPVNALETGLGVPANIANQIVQWRSQNGHRFNTIADLLNVTGINQKLLATFADEATVSTTQLLPGRVNVNTAPIDVLTAAFNGDQTLAQLIVNSRSSGTTFNSLNDLFNLDGLSVPQLRTLATTACVKSSFYLIRIKVRLPDDNVTHAAEAVVFLPQIPNQNSSASPAGQLDNQNTSTSNPAPLIIQFHQVPRDPGWSEWVDPSTFNQ